MQIPTGSEFGGRISNVKATNVGKMPAVDGSSGAIFKNVSNLLDKKIEANEKIEAENSLFQYQKKMDSINNQVIELYLTKQITAEQVMDKHQELFGEVKAPEFDHYSLENRKQYLLQVDKITHNNKQSMIGNYNKFFQEKAEDNLTTYKDNAQSVLQNTNSIADFNNVKVNIFDDDSLQQLGQACYGEDWPNQQQQFNKEFDYSYLDSQLKKNTESGNVKGFEELNHALGDKNQFTGLSPYDRNQYIEKNQNAIYFIKGSGYGNTLASAATQQLEKTGDYSAINAYGLLSSAQGDTVHDTPDNAKQLAAQIGVVFDQQKFDDDPQYMQQLRLTCFNQAIDQYGSPTMAAIAMQVGDKEMNNLVKSLGNPNEGQISEEEFIQKIPDKKLRQTALTIRQQVTGDGAHKLNIEDSLAIIDRDKHLNDNEKTLAKAELRTSLESLQKQQQDAYRDNHQSLWRDVYINQVPLKDLDPQQIHVLKTSDQAALLAKPIEKLDLSILGEARGRLKAGDEFDVLSDYATRLPTNALDKLLTLQQELANNPEKRDAFTTMSALVNQRSSLLGINNKQQVNQLNDAVTDEIENFETSKGRKANQQERRDITDKHVLQAKLDEPFYRKREAIGQNAQTEKEAFIPEHTKQQIIKELETEGLAVTDENIDKVYQGVKYVG